MTDWLRKQRMGASEFQRWLDKRGITVTRQHCDQLVKGKSSGPRFSDAFYKITGIRLVDGLVEDR